MMMRTTTTPLLGPEGLKLELLLTDHRRVTLFVSTTGTGARCPVCDRYSGRVHSRYERAVADLPWHGVPVTLRICLRRFFCDNVPCQRSIFAERLPEVATYARPNACKKRSRSSVSPSEVGQQRGLPESLSS
jgi:transposase